MLSLQEQRELAKKLTAADKRKIAKLYIEAEQKGQGGAGFWRGLKRHSSKFAKASWPVIKVLGPVILKEVAIPAIRAYMAGGALNPSGGALKPAGSYRYGMRSDTTVRRSNNRIRLG